MELYLLLNGEQSGPYNEQQIVSMIAMGEVSRTDYAWHSGLSEWTPVDAIISIPPSSPKIQSVNVSSQLPTRPNSSYPKKWIWTLGSIAILFFSSLYFISPYCSLFLLKRAVDNKDAVYITDHVDFPQFRESLKAALHAEMAKDVTTNKTEGFEALGAAFGALLIGPMIDALVTPEAIIAMMQGKGIDGASEDAEQQSENVTETTNDSMDIHKMGYETLNRFAVTTVEKSTSNSDDKTSTLLFSRSGFFSWKLAGIRIESK